MPKSGKIQKVLHIDDFDSHGNPITVFRLKELIKDLRDNDMVEIDYYNESGLDVFREETKSEYEERIRLEKQQKEERKRQERLKQYLKLKAEFEQGETQ